MRPAPRTIRRAIRKFIRVQRCSWRSLTADGKRAHAAIVLLALVIPIAVAFAAPIAEDAISPASDVHHENVVVSMPVLITACVFVAGLVWAIAQYDTKRVRRIDRLHNSLASLAADVQALKAAKKNASRCSQCGHCDGEDESGE